MNIMLPYRYRYVTDLYETDRRYREVEKEDI